MDRTRDWLSLSLAPGLGPAGFWNLVNWFGSPTAVLGARFADLQKVAGMSAGQIRELSNPARLRRRAEEEMDRLAVLRGRPITFADKNYPELLGKTVNPPPVLYIKGKAELLNTPAVAIVGSRAATSYGRRTAFSLARDLAFSNVTIISGLATGIDTEAHAGCLKGQGGTVGVLGCGLDVTYPKSNTRLYSQIVESGVLVSEYPLGTRPEGFRFPARNRIISGMSRGVIVVEAAKKSGSLITVQFALEEGREVFAVPGQIDSVKSNGTHWLLQQGASLIMSANDVIDSLQLELLPRFDQGNVADSSSSELDPEVFELLSVIEHYPKSRDEILQNSGLTPAKLSEHLLLLELDGMVELLAGDEVRKL